MIYPNSFLDSQGHSARQALTPIEKGLGTSARQAMTPVEKEVPGVHTNMLTKDQFAGPVLHG